MKICMFVNNPISRDPRVTGEARILKKAGHEVTVIGTYKDGMGKKEVWNNIIFLRINNKKIPINKIYLLIKALLKLSKNSEIIKSYYYKTKMNQIEKLWIKKALEEKYDIYHAHDLDTLNIAYHASQKSGSKLVYDSHELWVEWQRNKVKAPNFKLDRWSKTEKEVCPKVDKVITVSDGIAAILQNDYSLNEKPLVLYNCAELKVNKKMNILCEHYLKTDQERKIVLYQGGIQTGRGLELFIEIAKHNNELDFVIIGPTNNKKYGKKIKESAADISNIFVLDPVPYEELWKITCSSDLGYVCTEPICLSYELGLSNKIFEYMVAGLPIVASSVKGHIELSNKLPENLDPFYLIDHKNAEKSSEIIKKAILDEETMIKKAKNSRFIAENLFNRELEFKKLVDVYNAF